MITLFVKQPYLNTCLALEGVEVGGSTTLNLMYSQRFAGGANVFYLHFTLANLFNVRGVRNTNVRAF